MSGQVRLDQDLPEIQYLCEKDKRLGKLISMVGPIEYTLHDDNSYAFLVHEIIEQMLSAKVGERILTRLRDLCGGEVTPDSVTRLTDEQIKSTGTSNRKVRYIRYLTQSAQNGLIDIEELKNLSDKRIMQILTSIHGIGTWTAKMYLIFVLDRPNVLPFEDAAFLQVYRWLYHSEDCCPEDIQKKCKRWSPYATYASRFFYKALDAGLTKEKFNI